MRTFCLLYRVEFTALLNNFIIKGIPENRFFQNEIDLKSILLNTPFLDFDEEYLIIKYGETELNCCKHNGCTIELNRTHEIIPLTQLALNGYQRKFSPDLIWTHPKKYDFELIFQDFLKEKIEIESANNLLYFNEYFLRDQTCFFIDNSILKSIYKARLAKQFELKRDLEIEKNEFDHVFATLMIYEQGSHFSRENALGFLLNAITVMALHNGLGKKFTTKNELNKSKLISKIKSIISDPKNHTFKDLFENDAILYEFTEFNKNVTNLEFSQFLSQIKILTYYSFFNFLITEKHIKFTSLFNILNAMHDLQDLTKEEKCAFQLNVLNLKSSLLSEDFMRNFDDFSIFNTIYKPESENTAFILNYYFKKKETIVNQQALNFESSNHYIRQDEIFHEIKNLCLSKKFKNSKEKTDFLNDEIIPRFSSKLKAANIKFETKTAIKEIIKLIWAK